MSVHILQRLKSAIPALAGVATACVLSVGLALTVLQRPSDFDSSSSTNSAATSQSQFALEDHAEEAVDGNTLVADLVELESEYARIVTLRQMLANTNKKGALELLDQTVAVAQPKLRLRLQVQIVQKLASIDPAMALDHAQNLPMQHRNQFLEVVFEEWSVSALDEALSHAATLENKERLGVLRTIFRTREDLSTTRLSQIAHDLGYGGMATRLKEDLLVKSASRNPEDSWNQILEDPWRDYSQVMSLVDVADAWIKAEGRDVLYQIAESIPNHRTRTQVIRILLGQFPAQDAPEAFDYARSLYDQTDDSIFRASLFWWTANDPYSAFEAVTELEDKALRLKMQTTVADRWAQVDPLALLQNIADFPTKAQVNARRIAIGEIANTSPRNATKALAQLPSDETKSVAEQLAYRWAMKNVQEVVDWIQTDPTVHDYQDDLLVEVFRVLVRTDSEAAMKLALNRPVRSSYRSLEYQVVRLLISENKFEESLALLPRVREGSSQVEAFYLVGLNLALNKNINQALELGEQLSASRRDIYLRSVMRGWAFNDAQGLYLSMDNMSDWETKRLAANALAEYPETLNKDQREHVKTLTGRDSLHDDFETMVITSSP
ncbi:MAG: hypothetical protein F4X44_09385 [Gammaproteobacteria bacterium]|nr:hypothetical protein [Gammaproteobacteria bacterium]MYD80811.1 hypothetical protein [Gammaproteobacteria bacterium]